MNIITRIILAFFLFILVPLHAGDAAPRPEALKAFNEFTSYLNQEFARVAQVGTLPGPPETTLPEARRRCAALVAVVEDRKDIVDAARLTLQAYSYAVTNLALPKAQRKVPENKILADLLALNQAGPTEGQILKCYQVTLVRLTKHFGKPSLTEEQVMGRKDVDFGSIVVPKTSPDGNAREQALPVEVAVAVAADGSLKLNDKALQKQELAAALKKLKAEAEADEHEVILTIYADAKSKYEQIVEVLDATAQAGVTNVSFQAMVEQAADGKTPKASQPPH